MLIYLENFQLYSFVWLASNYLLDKRHQIFLPIQQDPHSHIHEIQVPEQYFASQILVLMLVADFLRLMLMLLMLGLLYYFVLHQEGNYCLRYSYFSLRVVVEGADQVVDLVDDLEDYWRHCCYHRHHRHHHRHLITSLVSYYSLFDIQFDTSVVFHLTNQMMRW